MGLYGMCLGAMVGFPNLARHSPQRMKVDIRLWVFDYAYRKCSLVGMFATPSRPKVLAVDTRKQRPELMSDGIFRTFLIEI